jgi:hypothetical protein
MKITRLDNLSVAYGEHMGDGNVKRRLLGLGRPDCTADCNNILPRLEDAIDLDAAGNVFTQGAAEPGEARQALELATPRQVARLLDPDVRRKPRNDRSRVALRYRLTGGADGVDCGAAHGALP